MIPFEGLFQIAYVTRDLDQAMREARVKLGIANMLVMRDLPISSATRIDIALAWIGDWMIEFIQARGDGSSVYEAISPSGDALLRQHHLGHLLKTKASWDRLGEWIAASGELIFFEADTGPFHYIFLDMRTTLGHFTEHMICTEEGLAILDSVPRN